MGGPLAPGIGEIIGGSQREERLDVLDRNMAERGIDREHSAWYRDLRPYGTVPHAAPSRTLPACGGGRSGGLGFGRTLAYVTRLIQCPRRHPFPTDARERAVLTHKGAAPDDAATGLH